MDARFYETALRQISSALLNLCRPTPDDVDHIVNEIHMIATVAAEAGLSEVSTIAAEAQVAARSLTSTNGAERVSPIDAIGRLGHRLLSGLCYQVCRFDPVEAAQELRRRVLVVDDSRVSSLALSNAFRRRDFSVRSAVILEDALAELLLFSPAVLVSDTSMPNIDVELVGRVFRGLSHGRPSLFVLVSHETGEALKTELKRIAPDVFLPKASGSAKVVTTVLAHLDAGGDVR